MKPVTSFLSENAVKRLASGISMVTVDGWPANVLSKYIFVPLKSGASFLRYLTTTGAGENCGVGWAFLKYVYTILELSTIWRGVVNSLSIAGALPVVITRATAISEPLFSAVFQTPAMIPTTAFSLPSAVTHPKNSSLAKPSP